MANSDDDHYWHDRIDYRQMYSGIRKPARPRPATKARTLGPTQQDQKQSNDHHGEGYRRRKSMRRAIKEQLCNSPDINVDELISIISDAGYDVGPTTAVSIRSDFRDTIKVAVEMGYVKVISRSDD